VGKQSRAWSARTTSSAAVTVVAPGPALRLDLLRSLTRESSAVRVDRVKQEALAVRAVPAVSTQAVRLESEWQLERRKSVRMGKE